MNNSKTVTKKSTKITLKTLIAVFTSFLLVLTGVGTYLSIHKKDEKPEVKINPIEWSVKKYDGAESDSLNWLRGDTFAKRGEKTYTINSAESFLKFVEIVNSNAAADYGYFKEYTIYLNKNIDFNGYQIPSIGVKLEDGHSSFQGIFDGSYYTISNAVFTGAGLFNFTENATIKNIGTYNCTIDTTADYAGGILAEGINTTIENCYVRLGSISSTKTVGGLVGKLTIDRTNYSSFKQEVISNSFADTTLNSTMAGGLFGEIDSNNSDENSAKVVNSYFNSLDRAYYINNTRVTYENVIALTQGADFTEFNV